MSRRNLAWLVAVIAVGIIVWIAAGLLWGVLAAIATLVLSEVVERIRRRRRAAAGGRPVPSVRSAIAGRRRTR